METNQTPAQAKIEAIFALKDAISTIGLPDTINEMGWFEDLDEVIQGLHDGTYTVDSEGEQII